VIQFGIATGRLENIEVTSMLGAIAGDIIGLIYEHHYGAVPEAIGRRVYEILDEPQGGMTRTFTETYGRP
jgi:hypothetical protein